MRENNDLLLTVIKKMINNRWMVGCLLIGFILAVAMVCSIPLYTNGILQKMLTSDLEMYQTNLNVYPGNYEVKTNLRYLEKEERLGVYTSLKKNLYENLLPEIPLPTLSINEEITIDSYEVFPAVQREEKPRNRYVSFTTIAEMEKHININHGRLYSSRVVNDTIEVIVTESFLRENDLFLGETLYIKDITHDLFTNAKITGIFSPSDYQDTFWAKEIDNTTVFFDYSIFIQLIVNNEIPLITSSNWNIAFNYHEITIDNIGTINVILERHHRLANSYRHFLDIDFKAEPILLKYSEREKQLRLTLWIINIPVLILLFFYLFMISNQIMIHEQNEIAVLKSRGKSTFQVFLIYLFESLIISVIALLFGPPLGFLICKFMGASNGFLEFVRRTPLQISFSFHSYLYSMVTAIFLIITIIIPAYFSTKTSIVQLQQQKARGEKKPVRKKFFIDILILALAGYGIFRYQSQQNILEMTGASSIDIGIDPLLFLTSTFFILGIGLLFLRIFPMIIRIIHHIGKKTWSPVMYCAILEVERAGNKGQFLMLFLIFSIAIGIFNANMARTLNRNIEDRVRYAIGADITIQPEWTKRFSEESYKYNIPTFVPDDESDTFVFANSYSEPPFIPYTQIEGVDKATKVFRKSNGKVLLSTELVSNIEIRGIIPHEFGEIAWFRDDLLPYHWHNYLNLLADAPNALLVSRHFQTLYNLRTGDPLNITWGNQGYIRGIIYAFIDYWPDFNPFATSTFNTSSYLVVANLTYLQNKLVKDPYQIWIRKKKGVEDKVIYDDIEKKELNIEAMTSMSQEIIKRKNDPLLKGINGVLTQGFILIMLVCTIGFLIYWILSLQSRILQFGIFRAIGLSQQKVILIIILEQLMLSGTALLAGIIIGGIASDLFVPFLQLVFSSTEQVPPFTVIALRSDYYKIYIIVLIMLGTGLLFLRFFIRKLKIGRALKLGED